MKFDSVVLAHISKVFILRFPSFCIFLLLIFLSSGLENIYSFPLTFYFFCLSLRNSFFILFKDLYHLHIVGFMSFLLGFSYLENSGLAVVG